LVTLSLSQAAQRDHFGLAVVQHRPTAVRRQQSLQSLPEAGFSVVLQG
tara:strand:+ start:716 stop:859 length:144 start_codon:yes stop_codon:yes gene_type:complete